MEDPLINSTSRKSAPICNNLTKALAVLLLLSLAAAAYFARETYTKEDNDDASDIPASFQNISDTLSSYRNLSVDPCDDFYQYACGSWEEMNKNNIPAGSSCYSTTVCGAQVVQNNYAILHEIAQEGWPVIGPYFDACMNTKIIDNVGTTPFSKVWDTISSVTTKSALFQNIGALYSFGIRPFFSAYVVVDAKEPTQNVLDIGQGGISLDKEQYEKDTPLWNEYLKHIRTMFYLYYQSQNIAITNATIEAQATTVANLEFDIASMSLPLNDLRDPYFVYNKFTYDGLVNLAPSIDWMTLFNGAEVDVTRVRGFIVEVPMYLANVSSLVEATSLDDLKIYTQWLIIHEAAKTLPSAFVDEDFRFFSQEISGVSEPAPRWKSCVDRMDVDLTDIFDRYYIERAFSKMNKKTAENVILYVKRALNKSLGETPWMDPATRILAKEKLENITDLVGYPDKWATYDIDVSSHEFFTNVESAKALAFKRDMERLYNTPNKFRWQMTYSTDNAYYDPTYNTVNFPAGILQPILFSADFPAVVNFGGLGATAGHELTHAFDDQGSQYDGTGRLHKWWNEKDTQAFKERAKCFVKQYDEFTVYGKHVNGSLTLGENIADNGGIKEAFNAYKLYVTENGEEDRLIPDLTNEQAYFLSYAQGWCTLMTEKASINRLSYDVHSPAFARVNGPLMNFDGFSDAFKCKKGTKMNPHNKCVLW